MNSLNDINKRRRRIRKGLTIGLLPLILCATLFSIKVLSMNAFAESSQKAFTTGNFTQSQQSAERQKFANMIEGWKAYYNDGTALVALHFYDNGISNISHALTLVKTPSEQCDIRANLAVALEANGRKLASDKSFAKAQKEYDQAKIVLHDADPTCLDKKKNPAASNSLEQTKERLNDSKKDPNKPTPVLPQPTPEQIKAIQEQIEINNQVRQDEESSKPTDGNGANSGNPTPSGDSVDKPW